MPKAICPACGKGISITPDEVNLYNQYESPLDSLVVEQKGKVNEEP